MLYKKKGMPEENDIVICTVKKILYHSIFVYLDEYEHKEGMIHISEVAPGRIRNLRDYVKEGKRLVCIVLKIHKDKGHIDLSIRRVPMSMRNNKNEEWKQEIKSEKLLEYIGKQIKTDLKTMYKKVGNKLIDHFGLLQIAFNEIAVQGKAAIAELKIPSKEADLLVSIVQEKIKPPEVKVTATFVLQSTSPSGVIDIKESLEAGEKLAQKKKWKANFVYISAPKYKAEIFANEYKVAEEELEEISKVILKEAKKRKVSAEIQRKK